MIDHAVDMFNDIVAVDVIDQVYTGAVVSVAGVGKFVCLAVS